MVDVTGSGSGGEVLDGGLRACEDEGVAVESRGWFREEHAVAYVDGEEEVDR